jgi:Tripartite tricarboxylate transporter TctB family
MPSNGRNGLTTLARVDRAQMIAVAAWVLLALGVQILGAPLEMFTSFGPGPGFFLKSLSVVLLILALLQGLALIRAAGAGAKPIEPGMLDPKAAEPAHDEALAPSAADMDRGSIARFLLLSVVLFAYAWLLPLLGFAIATAALCWTTLVLLRRRPLRALIEAVAAALLVRYAFTAGLGVPLPEAQLRFLEQLGF